MPGTCIRASPRNSEGPQDAIRLDKGRVVPCARLSSSVSSARLPPGKVDRMSCDPARPSDDRPAPAPGVPLDGSARDLHHDKSGSLLWIDDEVAQDDGAVRLLELEGFQVDCAVSGEQGVAMAQAGTYDGIILDQRLPDMSGIGVLEQMRSVGLSTPVLLLTGYPDVELAVSAIHLGAWDYKPKTLLLGEDWTAVMHALVDSGRRPRTPTGPKDERGQRPVDSDHDRANKLAADLEAVASSHANAAREATLLLTRAVLDPVLGTHLFAIYCKAFHDSVPCDPCGHGEDAAAAAAHIIRQALGKPRAKWPPMVRDAIAALEKEIAAGRRPSEQDVASELCVRVHASHLGRAVHAATGLYFEEWRRALIMRPVLSELAGPDEQVRQIGYRAGYEWPPQFTREFHELLGLSPTEFRHLCRSVGPA